MTERRCPICNKMPKKIHPKGPREAMAIHLILQHHYIEVAEKLAEYAK